jgi:glycosyltransferase involved in cell wall biosynthesis
MKEIYILLSTYNGEKYLDQQINSIIQQTYKKWKLIIRDDGSNDRTVGMIEKYCNLYPEKIITLGKKNTNLGVLASFSNLLTSTNAQYIMFCDQDDVWLPRKIEITYEVMKQLENKYGENTPLLIHTDLTVVNGSLEILSSSFQEYQDLAIISDYKTHKLLLNNVITGSTMMINDSLRKIVKSIPSESIMHDWWIGLVAASFGHISYIQETTILYRQHNNNVIGAKKRGFLYFLDRVNNINKIKADIEQTFIQAQKFREVYEENLNDAQIQTLDNYIQLPQSPFLIKQYLIIKYGYYRIGKLKNLGFFVFT